jgi:hypothetical protein
MHALVVCQHFELTNDPEDLTISINIMSLFILSTKDGTFLNYVNEDKKFTEQNSEKP